MPRPARVALTTTLAALTALLATAPAAAAPAVTTTATTAPAVAPRPADTPPTDIQPADTRPTATDPRVVVIGVTGLRWDDVHTLSTPALWDLSRRASIGTVAARSVRSSSCPADGWLAVSSGARAADLPGEAYGECRSLRDPLADGSVRGWADFVESARTSGYDPRLGLLGQVVTDAGVTATAVGPGAAIALAGPDGTLAARFISRPHRSDLLRTAVADALRESRLVVVDAGSVRDIGRATVPRVEDLPDDEPDEPQPEPPPTGEEPAGGDVIAEPTRAQQVRPVDDRVGAVLDAVADVVPGHEGDGAVTVLLVSLADSGTRARMQLAAAVGPTPGTAGRFGESLLGSRSTRQPGMIQATDVTPTVLAALGLLDQAPVGSLVGSAVAPVAVPHLNANERLTAVLDVDQHSAAVRPITPRFYTFIIVVNLALYLVVTVGLNGRALAAVGRAVTRRLPRVRITVPRRRAVAVLHGLRTAGVVVGALPVASFLANLSPWWRAPSPGWALVGAVAGWTVVVSTLALAPRWRHPLLGPTAVVAGTTATVLVVDVLLGGALQVSAPMGVQPVVAGRFYGVNNTSFALLAAAATLCAVVLADPLVRAGRRRLAAVLVAVVGVVVTVVDGLPGLGSDFGGPPALVPGFAVLALLTAGVRVSWWRLVGVLGTGAAVVVGFAVLDWLRPPGDRTHLGRFVDTVLDGGLVVVVGRKLAQNVANLGGTWLTLLALAGIGLVVLVLVRPLRRAAGPDAGGFGWLSAGVPLTGIAAAMPMLRPGLVGLGLTLGIGFAVNDSGIVIPALGVSVAVPLLVAVYAGWLLDLQRAAPPALDARPRPAVPVRRPGRPASATRT